MGNKNSKSNKNSKPISNLPFNLKPGYTFPTSPIEQTSNSTKVETPKSPTDQLKKSYTIHSSSSPTEETSPTEPTTNFSTKQTLNSHLAINFKKFKNKSLSILNLILPIDFESIKCIKKEKICKARFISQSMLEEKEIKIEFNKTYCAKDCELVQLLYLNKQYILIGSYYFDVYIKMFDLNNGQIVKTYKSSGDGLLKIDSNTFATSGRDIQLWKLDQEESYKTFSNIYGSLIKLNKEQILSVNKYEGGRIRIWNIISFDCIKDFNTNFSFCVIKLNVNKIACFDGNNNMQIWELHEKYPKYPKSTSYNMYKTYTNDDQIQCNFLKLNETEIITYNVGLIQIWDLVKYEITKVVETTHYIAVLTKFNDKILLASGSSHLSVFEINTWKCIKVIQNSYYNFYVIIKINDYQFAHSKDNKIIINDLF